MSICTYHILWTTYGTWLPGDARGWVQKGNPFIQHADPALEQRARKQMREDAIALSDAQRSLIEHTIREHCRIRRWPLHALNVRSSHIHIVVSADRDAREVMKQLKAWCSRRLSDAERLDTRAVARGAGRRRWFTEGGRMKLIDDDTYFEIAVRYVLDGQ